MDEHKELILDGTKINWHLERVQAWERGERIAPITIDMALTRACNYSCHFCYAMFQENDRKKVLRQNIFWLHFGALFHQNSMKNSMRKSMPKK